ncbi:MAG: Triosephosphate isomerase [Candidatus Heimdallarchaeota archaeon LC_3]|nr:MAG: Triosephosphate isomerase [Candidatus Heimdallarchaeota archaeon LC_3]
MKITYPAIFLNCKTYVESSGDKGINLAKIANKTAKEYNCTIIIIPQHPLLAKIVDEVDIPVFSQSIDARDAGSHTGWIIPENLKSIGVEGTLINHSEHRDTIANIERSINLCKDLSMYSLACSNNVQTSLGLAACLPDAIAMEPPELIGSGISVSTKPEIIKETIFLIKKHFKEVKTIVGAGVSNQKDVSDSIKLNAEGILLASAFVKAKDPEKILIEMVEGLNKK